MIVLESQEQIFVPTDELQTLTANQNPSDF